MRRHKKPKSRIARIREGIEGVLDEAEDRTTDLRKRADKMRGEAKKRLQEEAQALESREKELINLMWAESRRITSEWCELGGIARAVTWRRGLASSI